MGSAFIVLAATLGSLGTIPIEGMVLILGVDRLMAESRSVTNLIGNGVATIVVAKWEKEFDAKKAEEMFALKVPPPIETSLVDSPDHLAEYAAENLKQRKK